MKLSAFISKTTLHHSFSDGRLECQTGFKGFCNHAETDQLYQYMYDMEKFIDSGIKVLYIENDIVIDEYILNKDDLVIQTGSPFADHSYMFPEWFIETDIEITLRSKRNFTHEANGNKFIFHLNSGIPIIYLTKEN